MVKNVYTVLLLGLLLSVGCSKDGTKTIELPHVTVGLELTRVAFDEEQELKFEKDDEFSVFLRNTANAKYAVFAEVYGGLVELMCVDPKINETQMTETIVVYPYREDTSIRSQKVAASIPCIQSYKKGTYDPHAGLLIGSTQSSNVTLQNVIGWLGVPLKGNGVVSSVTLRGNNDEDLTGSFLITPGTLKMLPLETQKTVILECNNAVTLTDTEEYFYFCILPVEFEKGITLKIGYANGTEAEVVIDSSVRVVANRLKKLSALDDSLRSLIRINHSSSRYYLPQFVGDNIIGNILWGDGESDKLGNTSAHVYKTGGNHEVTIEAWNVEEYGIQSLYELNQIDLSQF